MLRYVLVSLEEISIIIKVGIFLNMRGFEKVEKVCKGSDDGD
jgi:hypothetical protein